MQKKISLIFLVFALVACNLPQAGLESVASSEILLPQQIILVEAPPGATATATPFQPMQPTPTYLPTEMPTPTEAPTPTPGIIPGETRTWADYPGPTVWPDIEIPPPIGILAQPAGQVNILLLGSDQRPYEGGFRTDTILLLTLNPSAGSVSLTSFPRDLYVYIPGWTVNRINTAMVQGGFEMLALTMEYNLGVHPDHYVLINFSSFEQAIDSLGGLYVNVGQTLTDHRDRYGDYTVYAGSVYMDGETALWYVRSRYSTSDFDRGRRQQEVVEAAYQRLLSLDALSKAPQFYEIYRNNVTTDMNFEDMALFLPLAAQLKESGSIRNYTIGPAQVMNYYTYAGAQVLLPIPEAVQDVMRQALNTP